MKPGATIIPEASKAWAPAELNFPGAPTSLMRSPSSNTSSALSVLEAGSRTRPFLISSIFLGVPLLWNGFRRRAGLRGAVGGPAVVRRGLRSSGVPALLANHQQIQNG